MKSLRKLMLAALLPIAPSFQSAQSVPGIPIYPNFDPFYTPPAGFGSTEPGTVLRQRVVIPSFLGVFLGPVTAYQLLYRTTAVDGTPISSVTTVFVPPNAKQGQLISFSTSEDASNQKCAPSYTYQYLAQQQNLIIDLEGIVLQSYLASGYIVASADNEGPDSAFGPGHLAGQITLDGIRAVNNYMKVDNAVVGYGYSGGAIASGWASALQPTYAPELNIKGWAHGGMPSNLTSVVLFLDGTLLSGLLPAAVAGLAAPSAYGAVLTPILTTIVSGYGNLLLAANAQQCLPQNLIEFAGQKVLDYRVQSLGPNLIYQPQVANVLSKNILGVNPTETPTAPVLLTHATNDETIPYKDSETLYKNWCADGASVQFNTYAAGGHITAEFLALVPTVQWVESAFAGTVKSGCSRQTLYTNVIDPIALGADVEPVLIEAANALIKAAEADSGNLSVFATNA